MTAPRIRLACADPACPCRHAQAPLVESHLGPDGTRRSLVEVETPADIRALLLPAVKIARSRWFQYVTGARG